MDEIFDENHPAVFSWHATLLGGCFVVKAMSALFGYYLRKADVRYQLDKIVSLHEVEDEPAIGTTWNWCLGC